MNSTKPPQDGKQFLNRYKAFESTVKDGNINAVDKEGGALIREYTF